MKTSVVMLGAILAFTGGWRTLVAESFRIHGCKGRAQVGPVQIELLRVSLEESDQGAVIQLAMQVKDDATHVPEALSLSIPAWPRTGSVQSRHGVISLQRIEGLDQHFHRSPEQVTWHFTFLPDSAQPAQPLAMVWRNLDAFLRSTHAAEIVVREVTPQTGEMNRLVRFEVLKSLRGAFKEAPGVSFPVQTKIFQGPITALPLGALNALWHNMEPVPGEHYFFYATRPDASQKVSISALLQDFRKEKVSLEDFASWNGLHLWAWERASTSGTDWVAEASLAGDKRLRVRLLWLRTAPRELTPSILVPCEALNGAVFKLSVRTKAGVELPLKHLGGPKAACGVDEIPLDGMTAFEFMIDVSQWFEWHHAAGPYRVQVLVDIPPGPSPHHWHGKIHCPILDVAW